MRVQYIIAHFLMFLMGCTALQAAEMDGEGFFCVGVQGSGEDLFYGIIFYKGKVKMLSFVKDNDFGGEHVQPAPNNKDGAYSFYGPNTIKWQSGPYRHEMDKRLLKHTVNGGKKGFFRGLCFVEAPREIKLRLWEKIDTPAG
tara:strand:- start:173 stop:598 length:426 start_codon:yes stop_codon:yes gene_type:complete